MIHVQYGDVIYENPLSNEKDIEGWRLEGEGAISFPLGRMRMENRRDPKDGQAANIVHWCSQDLPDDVAVSWDFVPLREPGLAILFFAARGRNGEDVFDEKLAKRVGPYDQYHHGDINALHVSYFRRKHAGERAFQTCNLRKSYGFHMVALGADPLPSVPDVEGSYRIEVVKSGPRVLFSINDLRLFEWCDDGEEFGPVLTDGKIGFRQMAPLMADYANLKVVKVKVATG